MATLYLHIGTHKTGTTAIQNFCDANREALRARGFWYPRLPDRFNAARPLENGNCLIWQAQGADGSFERPEEEAAWWACVEYLRKGFSDCPNIILSEENIWNSPNRRGMWRNLRRAADEFGFDVRIVVYFRRQDQYINSYWAQRVKMAAGGALSVMRISEACTRTDECVSDYYEQLEDIAALFGRDHVIARVYDRARFAGGDVVPDFLTALGVPESNDFTFPKREANPSLGGNALEIKRIINALPAEDSDDFYDLRKLARTAAMHCYEIERERAEFSMLSEELRAEILQRYTPSNRLLARDYFGDENLALFPKPEPLSPLWRSDNPYMYEAIIRFFGMISLEQQRQINDLKRQKLNRSRLRRRLSALKRGFKRGLRAIFRRA